MVRTDSERVTIRSDYSGLPSNPPDGWAPAKVVPQPADAWGFYAPPVGEASRPAPHPSGPGFPQRPPATPIVSTGPPESGLTLRAALTVTAIGLSASVLLMLLAHRAVNPNGVVDTALRRALVLTLAFYVVAGLALGGFVLRDRVRLVWSRGAAADALILGIPIGLAGGLLGVGVNSLIAGHLSSDQNAEALVGGGGALRITLALVTMAVLAPLIEEVLFRGVLAGTLIARGTGPAMWGSAVAFAAWHMNPSALKYYAAMGLVFAALWLKRGLLASMSAHAMFNGVLTVAAVMATGGAGHTATLGSLAMTVPGGWHAEAPAYLGSELVFSGPAGAALIVVERPGNLPPSVGDLTRLGQDGAPGSSNVVVDAASAHSISLPVGEAATADLTLAGQPGHVLEVAVGTEQFRIVMVTSGSPAAERAWHLVINSLWASAP